VLNKGVVSINVYAKKLAFQEMLPPPYLLKAPRFPEIVRGLKSDT
jgi:hypothetical protein